MNQEQFPKTESNEEADTLSFQLMNVIKDKITKNIDNRNAEEIKKAFQEELGEYERIAKESPEDTTLWARAQQLEWIAQDLDWEFSQTPDEITDSAMKRELGSNGYFKHSFEDIRDKILALVSARQDEKLGIIKKQKENESNEEFRQAA